MHVYMKLTKAVVFAMALTLLSFGASFAHTAPDYKFRVHNNTNQAIKKILVSEDGKKWGYFDVGGGIGAGATEELVWDSSTDSENCEQWFKAVFANGEESEPVKFDFCEKDLVLEFK
jgi:hypothetical protein